MISTVHCGRFYKIFVSPMFHRIKLGKSRAFSLCSKLCLPPTASRLPRGAIVWRRRLSGPGKIAIFVSTKNKRQMATEEAFFAGDPVACGCVSFTRVRRKAEMPAHFLTLTLGLPEPVDSPRIAVKCEPYPGRWTHHIVLASADEIDAELLAWIDRAHQFAQR